MFDTYKRYYYFVMNPKQGTVLNCIVEGDTYPVKNEKIDIAVLREILERIYRNYPEYRSVDGYQIFFGERKNDGLIIEEVFYIQPKKGLYARTDKRNLNAGTNGRPLIFTLPSDAWDEFSISDHISNSNARSNNNSLIDVTSTFVGRTILIRSYASGLYASARGDLGGTPLCCSTSNRDAWEQFYVTLHNGGWISFLAYNNMYLTSDGVENKNYPPIKASAGRALGLEQFKIYKKGSRYSILSNYNKKWLMCHIEWDNNPVYAVSDKIDLWEEFDIEII